MKVLFLYPNISMSSMVPLGIASLSAYLKNHGVDTSVFDTTFYGTSWNENVSKASIGQVESFDFASRGITQKEGDIFYDFRKTVIDYKPDLIAVSMVEDSFYLGINLLRSIQDLNIPNVIGGVFPSFAPEKVLSENCVDMVCIGEGEETLLELVNVLAKNELPTAIHNIYYKDKKEIIKTPIRRAMNMNSLPIPDYDIFPRELLYRPMQGKVRLTIGIETQRGCPFGCAFCNSLAQKNLYKAIGGSFYRRKPINMIKRDLEYLSKKYKPEFIYWVADVFLAMQDAEWQEFYKMYMDFRIPFWANTRAETITKERVRQLEEMNCMRVNIGIEHGNAEFRKNEILRNTTDDELIEAFKCFKDSSITVVANTIIGYPGETEQLIKDSIVFNRKIAPYIDSITANIFAPYHGTVLRDKAIREGYISQDLIVNAGTTTKSLLNMPQLPDKKLKGLLRTFPLYVKLPETYYPDIKRCEEFDDEANRIYEDLLKEYQENFLNKKQGDEWVDLH